MKILIKESVLRQALAELERVSNTWCTSSENEITALRSALDAAEKVEPVAWEIFRDECYFDLWAVRLVGEKRWGYCYHVPTKEEAEALAKQLSTPAPAIPEGWQKDAERYRYLRHASRRECLDRNGPEAGCWIDCEDENHMLILLTEEDADNAIDAAMAKVEG